MGLPSGTSLPRVGRQELAPLLRGCFHRGQRRRQADLFVLRWGGRDALLKDFSARSFLLRQTWGRLVTRREVRILRQIRGVSGVPEILATVGSCGFLMARLPAQPMPRPSEPPPPLMFFKAATDLLRSLHSLGISHGDLRRPNLMVDAQGRPYLVDFATAVAVGSGCLSFLKRPLYRCFAALDDYGLVRLKAEFYPDSLSAEEAWRLGHPPWFQRAADRVTHLFRCSRAAPGKARNGPCANS